MNTDQIDEWKDRVLAFLRNEREYVGEFYVSGVKRGLDEAAKICDAYAEYDGIGNMAGVAAEDIRAMKDKK